MGATELLQGLLDTTIATRLATILVLCLRRHLRAAFGVRARRIGPHLEAAPHRLGRLGPQRRGGGVIQIDAAHGSGIAKSCTLTI